MTFVCGNMANRELLLQELQTVGSKALHTFDDKAELLAPFERRASVLHAIWSSSILLEFWLWLQSWRILIEATALLAFCKLLMFRKVGCFSLPLKGEQKHVWQQLLRIKRACSLETRERVSFFKVNMYCWCLRRSPIEKCWSKSTSSFCWRRDGHEPRCPSGEHKSILKW